MYDHSSYRWVSIKELTTFDFAPADILFLKYLKEIEDEELLVC